MPDAWAVLICCHFSEELYVSSFTVRASGILLHRFRTVCGVFHIPGPSLAPLCEIGTPGFAIPERWLVRLAEIFAEPVDGFAVVALAVHALCALPLWRATACT